MFNWFVYLFFHWSSPIVCYAWTNYHTKQNHCCCSGSLWNLSLLVPSGKTREECFKEYFAWVYCTMMTSGWNYFIFHQPSHKCLKCWAVLWHSPQSIISKKKASWKWPKDAGTEVFVRVLQFQNNSHFGKPKQQIKVAQQQNYPIVTSII